MARKRKLALQTSYVREYNIKLITSCLYKEPLSCMELSEKIGISDVGIRKIIKELESRNIVRLATARNEIKTQGNQHIRYEINSDLGVFIIIDFTKPRETFALYDFAGNKIYSERFNPPQEYTDEKELKVLIGRIKKRLKDYGLTDKKILNTTIAVTGQIDEEKHCFIHSGRFKIFEGDEQGRIYKIFEDAFNAPVTMKNNVAFMALGESEMGGFESNYGMSLFLYVGYGIATSVLHKGKALSGWRGYAGEIGYNKFESGESLFSNVTVSYMIQKSKPYLQTLDIEGLKQAYQENEKVKQIVLNGAKLLAYSIGNIINLLGVDVVMLYGENFDLGEEYINIIREEICKKSVTKANIMFARLQNPAVEGALSVARKKIIEDVIQTRYQ